MNTTQQPSPRNTGFCVPSPVAEDAQHLGDAVLLATKDMMQGGAGLTRYAEWRGVSGSHHRGQYNGGKKLGFYDWIADLLNSPNQQVVLRILAQKFGFAVVPVPEVILGADVGQLTAINTSTLRAFLERMLVDGLGEVGDVANELRTATDKKSPQGRGLSLKEVTALEKESAEALEAMAAISLVLKKCRQQLEG